MFHMMAQALHHHRDRAIDGRVLEKAFEVRHFQRDIATYSALVFLTNTYHDHCGMA